MKNPVVLNDNYIDADKVGYIGKIDTKVFAHLNKVIFFFQIIVEGKEVDIEGDLKPKLNELRNQLIGKCGISVQSPSDLMPS